VPVVDAYSSSSQSDQEYKLLFSVVEPPRDSLLTENGDVDRTAVGTANAASPPCKRIKRSSSPQEFSETRTSDAVTATTQPVHMVTFATTHSVPVAPALPLSSRIIGTVWQPVQSGSISAAVSTSTGINHSFCLSDLNYLVWFLCVYNRADNN